MIIHRHATHFPCFALLPTVLLAAATWCRSRTSMAKPLAGSRGCCTSPTKPDALASPQRILDEFEGGLNTFLDPSKRIKGLSTGFLKFDEMTGGLHESELFILAARPSVGKTALALNIAQHIAMN